MQFRPGSLCLAQGNTQRNRHGQSGHQLAERLYHVFPGHLFSHPFICSLILRSSSSALATNRRAESAMVRSSCGLMPVRSPARHTAVSSSITISDPSGPVPLLRYKEQASLYKTALRCPLGMPVRLSEARSGLSPISPCPAPDEGEPAAGAERSHGSSHGGASGTVHGHPAAQV